MKRLKSASLWVLRAIVMPETWFQRFVGAVIVIVVMASLTFLMLMLVDTAPVTPCTNELCSTRQYDCRPLTEQERKECGNATQIH